MQWPTTQGVEHGDHNLCRECATCVVPFGMTYTQVAGMYVGLQSLPCDPVVPRDQATRMATCHTCGIVWPCLNLLPDGSNFMHKEICRHCSTGAVWTQAPPGPRLGPRLHDHAPMHLQDVAWRTAAEAKTSMRYVYPYVVWCESCNDTIVEEESMRTLDMRCPWCIARNRVPTLRHLTWVEQGLTPVHPGIPTSASQFLSTWTFPDRDIITFMLEGLNLTTDQEPQFPGLTSLSLAFEIRRLTDVEQGFSPVHPGIPNSASQPSSTWLSPVPTQATLLSSIVKGASIPAISALSVRRSMADVPALIHGLPHCATPLRDANWGATL